MSPFLTPLRQGVLILAAALIPHLAVADAAIESAGRQVSAVATELVATLDGITDANSARSAQQRLADLMRRHAAAVNAFESAFGKARPRTEADGRVLERLMEGHARAAVAVSEAMARANERPGVAPELARLAR